MHIILGNKLNLCCLKTNIQILLVTLLLMFHITIRVHFAPSLLSIMSAAMTCAFDPRDHRMLPASKACCSSGVAAPCYYHK